MKIAHGISVFVLLLLVSFAVSPVFAAEKSDSCPTTFDPDNSAWAMHEIDITNNGLYRIHARRLSYLSDTEKYIPFSLEKIGNPDCVAVLVSYGPKYPNSDGKRVWGAIASPDDVRYYLFIDGAWERGDDIAKVFDCDTEDVCNLIFTLYKEKAPIASLVVVVR